MVKKTLTHIYKVSLNSGVFLDGWKIAKVKPLYEKGDRYDIQNNKPISVLSILSKVLERLMFKRLVLFYLIIGYLQKLKMVLGKENVLKQ